jgi:hypothetical protein
MKIQSYTDQVFKDLNKYQNVLKKHNWRRIYLSFIDEIIPIDSFVVLGGRPRTGKTTLVLDFIARNSLVPREGTLEFNNELMSRGGLVYFIGHKQERVLRQWFSIINQDPISNKENDQALDHLEDEYQKRIEGARIEFNFLSETKDIELIIKEDIEKFEPDYVIIDCVDNGLDNDNYGHDIQGYNNYGYNGDTLLKLVQLQKETKKLFLITRMLGDEAHYRSGYKLHFLEDFHSREIEVNADIVLSLTRPELYGLEIDEDGNSLKDRIEVSTILNRYDKEGAMKYWMLDNGIPLFNKPSPHKQ